MKHKLLVLFGILDFLTVIQIYELLKNIFNKFYYLPIINTIEITIIISLLFSGTLSILQKKKALIIYYFQFPFKLAFMILTFGFLLKLSIIPQESILFKIIS